MKSREEILSRIYKACFVYPVLKAKLFEDWAYIADLLENGEEERIITEILYCLDLWLDSEFSFLTF